MTKAYWIVANYKHDTDAVLYITDDTTTTQNISYSYVPRIVRHDLVLTSVRKFATKDDTKIYVEMLNQSSKMRGRWAAYKLDATDIFPESYVTRKVWDD